MTDRTPHARIVLTACEILLEDGATSLGIECLPNAPNINAPSPIWPSTNVRFWRKADIGWGLPQSATNLAVNDRL